MKTGDEVRVKVKETGEKVRALVTMIETETAMVDVTLGPEAAKLGERPDTFRRYMPGMTQTTITLTVIGPA